MLMEAAQKGKREQLIVFSLLAVFLLILAGKLKEKLGQPSMLQPAQALTPGLSDGGLGAAIRGFRDRLDTVQDEAAHPMSLGVMNAPVAYTADGLRDPFSSLLPEIPKEPPAPAGRMQRDLEAAQLPAPSLSAMKVSGWIVGVERPVAIVDRQVVRVGDVIKGGRIVSISPEGVLIQVGKTVVRLPASSAVVQHDSAAWHRLPVNK